jgi:hypothetical protein
VVYTVAGALTYLSQVRPQNFKIIIERWGRYS